MPPITIPSEFPQSVGTPITFGGQPFTPRTYKGSKARNVNLSSQSLRIGHQRVNIDVDLSKNKIDGLTEITVIPTTNHLKTIKLDCREMVIKEILVNNRQANFIHRDLLYINDNKVFDEAIANQTVNINDLYNKNLTIHQHHILRQKLNYIFGDIDEDGASARNEIIHGNTEELTIIIPDNLKLHLTGIHSAHTPSSQPNTATPSHMKSRNTYSESYTPIQLKIEYEVVNPKNGVNFVTELNKTPTEDWHAYTINSEYNISTSSWVPCIDNLWERNTWTVEVNIPRSLKDIGHPIIIGTKEAIESRKQENRRRRREQRAKGDDVAFGKNGEEDYDEDLDEDEEPRDLNVATGDYVETKEVPHPTDLSKKTVSWTVFNPVCAHHVGWAIGCFESVELPEEEEEGDDELGTSSKEISCPIKIYCFPGKNEMAENTCIFVRKAMNYFSKEFGSFPFNSHSILFVHGSPSSVNNYAGLSIIDDTLLYPSNMIEPIYPTTETIVDSIAYQWSGINIVPQQFNDMWCTIGIARFMSFQFLRVLMGTNEMKFRIKTYMTQTVQQDVAKKPLALWYFRHPISEQDLDFIKLKSPLVLSILDRRMTKTDKSFGLSRVLPKLFLQAMSGDLVNNTLSTQHFQYLCEKVNRNRLETFFKQWVFGSGTPVFNVSQRFNRKRSMIEVVVRQAQVQERKRSAPLVENFIDTSIAFLDNEPAPTVQSAFLGPMTIRVHEADGVPYEHIVELKDSAVKLDINYNSKFRRMKKHKEDAAEGGTYTRFGDIIQSPEELAAWGLQEWPPIDDEELYNNAFEWIRIDTDFEWIAKVNVRQPDYMYSSQLQYDRDVEAQYEAIRFFGNSEKPIIAYCTSLIRTLMDPRYYYGVRIAAAEGLARIARQENNFMGMNCLIKAYTQLFCFPNSTIPLANDFGNIPKFMLQREFPRIFCSIRDDNGNVPFALKDIILNLVVYNENSNNSFEDSLYVSSLIESLAGSIINRNATILSNLTLPPEQDANLDPKEKEFIEVVVEEINRQQKLDELVPSHHHTLAITCLDQKIRLARYGLLVFPLEELLKYTSSKYEGDIRIVAFKGLLVLGGLKNAQIMKYFLKSCLLECNDLAFRSKLVSLLVESVSVAAVEGAASTLDDPEFQTLEKYYGGNPKGAQNDSGLVVVEAGNSGNANSRRDQLARATLKGTIQLLRRDYSIGKGLRHVLWELLHSSLLSIYNKRSLFSVCQVLYKEIDSFIVDVSIPPVPLNELNRKLVAKYLGEGKISIHREGRFKISLATKIVLGKGKSMKVEFKPPKLKLKLGGAAPAPESVPTAPIVITHEPAAERPGRSSRARMDALIPQVRTSLVTRLEDYAVRFKISRAKLQSVSLSGLVRNN
ncbi:hypothetical protein CANTEDRAFT_120010, partial [Yamadazyma tenuis ATCC 10573]